MSTYGFNLDKLVDKDFINELKEITTNFYTEGRTIDLIDNQVGIKSKESLNMFTNDISVQDGTSCGFNPDGDINLIQKVIEVVPWKINQKICFKDLYKTYLSLTLNSKNDGVSWERKLAESFIVKQRRWAEIFLWNGSTDLNYNGLVYQIGTGSDGVIDASAEVEAASTKIAKVNAMINKANADILNSDDVRIFCNHSFYTAYIQELIAANLYIMPQVYNNGEPEKMELLIPATNIRLTPVLGLDYIDTVTVDDGDLLVMTYSKNLVAGYDGLGDSENFEMLPNPYDGNNVYVTMEGTLGCQYRWGDRIVKGYSLVSAS